jgi:hypothetical protein
MGNARREAWPDVCSGLPVSSDVAGQLAPESRGRGSNSPHQILECIQWACWRRITLLNLDVVLGHGEVIFEPNKRPKAAQDVIETKSNHVWERNGEAPCFNVLPSRCALSLVVAISLSRLPGVTAFLLTFLEL